MFVLSNQLSGRYTPATELDLIRFWPSPLGDLVWHLITQVNDGLLAAYIIVFDPRRVKRRHFIQFMVYALVCMSLSSNLVALATLIPWFDSV